MTLSATAFYEPYRIVNEFGCDGTAVSWIGEEIVVLRDAGREGAQKLELSQ